MKPKLSTEPTPEAAAAAPAEAPPPADQEPDAPAEAGKAKLKIKIPGALTEAAEAAAAEAKPKTPPPFPVVAGNPDSPGTPPAGAPPKPTNLRPPGIIRPPGAPVRKLPPAVMVAAEKKRRIVRLILVGIGGLAMAGGMMYVAVTKFIDPPPPPPRPKPRPAPVVVQPPPEVPAAVPEPVADAAKAALPAEQTEKPAGRTARPPRPKSGGTTMAATTDLAPGVTVTTDAVQAEVEASAAFRSFVAEARISGVFQGASARAFINGRLVRAGEVVDSSLGIRFDSVDATTKSIVFKDASGAKVSRHY